MHLSKGRRNVVGRVHPEQPAFQQLVAATKKAPSQPSSALSIASSPTSQGSKICMKCLFFWFLIDFIFNFYKLFYELC